MSKKAVYEHLFLSGFEQQYTVEQELGVLINLACHMSP